MKKEIIELRLDILDKNEIIKKFSLLKKNKRIKIILNRDFYSFSMIEELDREIYNRYDYVIVEKGDFAFSLNRDFIIFLISQGKEKKIKIEEIIVDNSHDSLKNQLNHLSSKDILCEKIDFLEQDYKEYHEERILKSEIFNIKDFITFVTIFLTFIGINFYSRGISLKLKEMQIQIEKKQEKIKMQESKLIKLQKEAKLNKIELPTKEKVKISDLLSMVDISINGKVYIRKIAYNYPLLTIYATANNLQTIYSLEENLGKNGVVEINNDYVKSIDGGYEFSIDGKLKGD